MSGTLPKVYCYISGPGFGDTEAVYALAEDGAALASHCSSDVAWAMADIGFAGDSFGRRKLYDQHYPDGYVLEWVADPDSHSGLAAALKRNHEKHEAGKAGE